ncbi:hypothetical protein TVAG_334210 [Trichomonas vaginalis G3]|uniref:Uncharacterized protein n=1 Tax=Trichomonas vaginalis (strain ATCC PRA-98 / G3) TaxID=412133 RepID=A2EIC7_TRIV3|nr:hypothetical protein TVAGG3_0887790 [Trichomonas vaginalis G3]EAY07609.1 hypothetical protein TVAG_334210 [Trichomonas vaginalis G3]KAI5502505.1 hypothetical protein TVAGG3_0887790 [Trichomonas vaginalis G3]|eukprot:XP_001319832.1 hypothetical protein [Trichomonas vaginalis G3]
MFFPFLFESFITFENFTILANQNYTLENIPNITSYIFAENSNNLTITTNGTEVLVPGKSFSSKNVNSILSDVNTTIYKWNINSSYCTGPIYEFSTPQLFYLETEFIKPTKENHGSCLFLSNFNPQGSVSISLFKMSSSISIYQVDEHNNVTLFGECGDQNCDKVKLKGKPFMIRFNNLPEFTYLDMYAKLDVLDPNVKCQNNPIVQYSGDQCFKTEFQYLDSAFMCTDSKDHKIGVIVVLSVLAAVVLMIVAIVLVICFVEKSSDSKKDSLHLDIIP